MLFKCSDCNLQSEEWRGTDNQTIKQSIRDVENILFPNSIKEFNFNEIDDIDNGKDPIPIFGALEGNRVYFPKNFSKYDTNYLPFYFIFLFIQLIVV